MKKLLGLLLVVLVLSACEGKVGPPGPPGKDGEFTYWKIIDFTIVQKDWELIRNPDEIGSYYYYVYDVSEITKAIYENGLIVCYFRYMDDFGVNVQSILPHTYYDILVSDKGIGFPYSVQYSYDVTPGSIAFKVVFSDFLTAENFPPKTCNFRLHLML